MVFYSWASTYVFSFELKLFGYHGGARASTCKKHVCLWVYVVVSLVHITCEDVTNKTLKRTRTYVECL